MAWSGSLGIPVLTLSIIKLVLLSEAEPPHIHNPDERTSGRGSPDADGTASSVCPLWADASLFVSSLDCAPCWRFTRDTSNIGALVELGLVVVVVVVVVPPGVWPQYRRFTRDTGDV